MKNFLPTLLKSLIWFVLGSKVLNAIFNFGEPVKRGLDIAMFVLLGIVFMTISYFWEKGLVKYIIGICGAFLVVVNFLPENTFLLMIALGCMVTPFLLVFFQKDKLDEVVRR